MHQFVHQGQREAASAYVCNLQMPHAASELDTGLHYCTGDILVLTMTLSNQTRKPLHKLCQQCVASAQHNIYTDVSCADYKPA